MGGFIKWFVHPQSNSVVWHVPQIGTGGKVLGGCSPFYWACMFIPRANAYHLIRSSVHTTSGYDKIRTIRLGRDPLSLIFLGVHLFSSDLTTAPFFCYFFVVLTSTKLFYPYFISLDKSGYSFAAFVNFFSGFLPLEHRKYY